MHSDLEQRLREALHDDAAGARLISPVRPADPDAWSLPDAKHSARSRWRPVAAIAAIVLIAAAGAVWFENARDHATKVTTSSDPADSTTANTAAGGERTIARGDDVVIGGFGALAGQTLNVDAVEQDGEVTGEFRVNNIVVTLECAATGFGGRDLILGGEVTENPDGQGFASPFGDLNLAVGDRVALVIREEEQRTRVTLYAPTMLPPPGNDAAGSCSELIEHAGGRDGGFFDNGVGANAIETNLLSETPNCEEWTEREVTADEVLESGCSDGDVLLTTTNYYECTDGRVLYQNGRVWGYVGEPAHAHEDGAELVAPDAEREACGF